VSVIGQPSNICRVVSHAVYKGSIIVSAAEESSVLGDTRWFFQSVAFCALQWYLLNTKVANGITPCHDSHNIRPASSCPTGSEVMETIAYRGAHSSMNPSKNYTHRMLVMYATQPPKPAVGCKMGCKCIELMSMLSHTLWSCDWLHRSLPDIRCATTLIILAKHISSCSSFMT
jgi:hypothetical protein